jgi:hypothetical protein
MVVHPDSRRIPRVPRYLGNIRGDRLLRLQGYYLLWRNFPERFSSELICSLLCPSVAGPGCSHDPGMTTATALASYRFRLFPFRSPLLRESRLISPLRGTKMFQFPRFPSRRYGFPPGWPPFSAAGLPHSGIVGSTVACTSPTLIVAGYALLRQPVPRHPPHALSSLRTPFP